MAKAEAKVEELVGMIERGGLRLPKHDQGILATAFRDVLVPPQDPDDEPASVLLERIKAECEGSGQPKCRRATS